MPTTPAPRFARSSLDPRPRGRRRPRARRRRRRGCRAGRGGHRHGRRLAVVRGGCRRRAARIDRPGDRDGPLPDQRPHGARRRGDLRRPVPQGRPAVLGRAVVRRRPEPPVPPRLGRAFVAGAGHADRQGRHLRCGLERAGALERPGDDGRASSAGRRRPRRPRRHRRRPPRHRRRPPRPRRRPRRPTPSATTTTTTTTTSPPTTTTAPTTTTTAPPGGGRFVTLPPGSPLPSDAECASACPTGGRGPAGQRRVQPEHGRNPSERHGPVPARDR